MEVVGGLSAFITVISSITKLAKSLNEVREGYNNVALNITLVASQLSTIKSALKAIADWREIAHGSSQVSRQLDEDLAVSLNCCAILVAVIDSKLGESGYTPGMKAKVRHLWLEDVLKEYLSNLDGQVRALHLLLTIFQCRSATEQSRKLEDRKSRIVIEHLRAETASLQPEGRELHDTTSMLSVDPSVNLELDPILLEHPVYRRVYGHYRIHGPAPASPAARDDAGTVLQAPRTQSQYAEGKEENQNLHNKVYQHQMLAFESTAFNDSNGDFSSTPLSRESLALIKDNSAAVKDGAHGNISSNNKMAITRSAPMPPHGSALSTTQSDDWDDSGRIDMDAAYMARSLIETYNTMMLLCEIYFDINEVPSKYVDLRKGLLLEHQRLRLMGNHLLVNLQNDHFLALLQIEGIRLEEIYERPRKAWQLISLVFKRVTDLFASNTSVEDIERESWSFSTKATRRIRFMLTKHKNMKDLFIELAYWNNSLDRLTSRLQLESERRQSNASSLIHWDVTDLVKEPIIRRNAFGEMGNEALSGELRRRLRLLSFNVNTQLMTGAEDVLIDTSLLATEECGRSDHMET